MMQQNLSRTGGRACGTGAPQVGLLNTACIVHLGYTMLTGPALPPAGAGEEHQQACLAQGPSGEQLCTEISQTFRIVFVCCRSGLTSGFSLPQVICNVATGPIKPSAAKAVQINMLDEGFDGECHLHRMAVPWPGGAMAERAARAVPPMDTGYWILDTDGWNCPSGETSTMRRCRLVIAMVRNWRCSLDARVRAYARARAHTHMHMHIHMHTHTHAPNQCARTAH